MKIYHILIALFLVVISTADSIGQQTFIQPVPSPSVTWTDSENQAFQKYMNLPSIQSSRIVQIGKLEDFQSHGWLHFGLPGQGRTYNFKAKRVEYHSTDDYVWEGESIGLDSVIYPDYLLLVNTDGLISGEISIGDQYYRIFPISKSHQMLIKMENLVGKECANIIENSSLGGTEEVSCTMNEDICRINLLIAYTPAVQQAYPYMFSVGRTLYEQVNTAFRRSKIKHRFQLVGVERLYDFWVDATAIGELNQLEGLLGNPGSYISNTKNDTKADLVVLLSMGANYTDGYGAANVSVSDPDKSCAVVGIAAGLSSKYTFSHEIGHVFGAQHQDENCCLPARGHSFFAPITGKYYKTILNVLETSTEQRILNYSNPNVNYFKIPTGETERNNACVMQNYGCTIAQLIPADACFFTANGLFNESCTSDELFVSVNIGDNFPLECNSSSLYYSFAYSLDGIQFQETCLTFDPFCNFEFMASIAPDQVVFVRVIIKEWGSSNVVATLFEWYQQNCPWAPDGQIPSQTRPSTATHEDLIAGVMPLSAITITPNPTSNTITFNANSDREEYLSIKIIDAQGKSVKSFSKVQTTGENSSVTIDVNSLPAGMYQLLVSGQTIHSTGNFIKQ